MGNDGGTIAKGQDLRAVYSSVKAGPLILEDQEKALFNTCALSSLPLFVDGIGQKVVSDRNGQLYLKEKILEYLLEKKSKLPHINSLGDVVDLKIKWDDGRIVCPVSGSTSTLVYLRPCGCVFSDRLLIEVRKHFDISDAINAGMSECPLCGTEFAFNYDVVMLNPEKNPKLLEFNDRNFEYLHLLHLSHAKRKLKRKKEGKKLVKRARTEKTNEQVKVKNGGN